MRLTFNRNASWRLFWTFWLLLGVSDVVSISVKLDYLDQDSFSLAAITVPQPVGYPAYLADAPQDSVLDHWGLGNRECVSYVAWKVQTTFHDMPNWSDYKTAGLPIPSALNWLALARYEAIPTGSLPKVDSVAIAMPGTLLNGREAGSSGHAMWVEAVNGDGTILVSQYNYNDTGRYSEMTIPATGLTYIYFGDTQ